MTKTKLNVHSKTAQLQPMLREVFVRQRLPKIGAADSMAVMVTMNISLPESLKAFIDEQVDQRGYGTSSEFVRELIRREQERQQLRALVLDGGASPTIGPADEAYFDRLRSYARGLTTAPPDADE